MPADSDSIPNTPSVATAAPTSPRTWLEQWPAARRSTISNWFHYAARAGATTPAAVIDAVVQELLRRLRFDPTDTIMRDVLEALQRTPQEAVPYAEEVLAWESLPQDVRQKRKEERSHAFQQQYMVTQPVTEKQRAFLRRLGHVGPAPANRLEASDAIDNLLARSREARA